MMRSFFSLIQLFVLLTFAGLQSTSASVIPDPSKNSLQRRFITPNSFGIHGGYFYNWWSDGTSPTAEYTNLALGGFQ